MAAALGDDVVINLAELRQRSERGLDGANRCAAWKVLLGVLPCDQSEWPDRNEQLRLAYQAYLDELKPPYSGPLDRQWELMDQERLKAAKPLFDEAGASVFDDGLQKANHANKEQRAKRGSSARRGRVASTASAAHDDDDTDDGEQAGSLFAAPSRHLFGDDAGALGGGGGGGGGDHDDDGGDDPFSDGARAGGGLFGADGDDPFGSPAAPASKGNGAAASDASQVALAAARRASLQAAPLSPSKRRAQLAAAAAGLEAEAASVQDPLLGLNGRDAAESIADAQLKQEIDKDVVRTRSGLHFFEGRILCAMSRILFVFAKLNHGVRYVQGMNELLAPLVYVAYQQPGEVPPEQAEADAFFLFSALLSEVRDVFIKPLDDTATGLNGIVAAMGRVLQTADPQLWQHFQQHSVDLCFFGYRWLTTLLATELNLPDTLRLWDALFADPRRFDRLLHTCVALLIGQRKQMLAGHFVSILHLIQDFPAIELEPTLREAARVQAVAGADGAWAGRLGSPENGTAAAVAGAPAQQRSVAGRLVRAAAAGEQQAAQRAAGRSGRRGRATSLQRAEWDEEVVPLGDHVLEAERRRLVSASLRRAGHTGPMPREPPQVVKQLQDRSKPATPGAGQK